MLREVGLVGVLTAAGVWATAALDQSYSRVVDRPPSEVASAIADLDIRKAPGSPGTDPTASGGVLPTFRVEQAANSVSYLVMANGQIATRMIARLEPVDDGRRTKVTASVERGDAPDDFVSPALRSESITMALFGLMLEEEIDKLVFPPKAWTANCDAIMAKFKARQGGTPAYSSGLSQAFGNTAKQAVALGQLDKELKAAGCPQNDGEFQPVTQHLPDGDAPDAPIAPDL